MSHTLPATVSPFLPTGRVTGLSQPCWVSEATMAHRITVDAMLRPGPGNWGSRAPDPDPHSIPLHSRAPERAATLPKGEGDAKACRSR